MMNKQSSICPINHAINHRRTVTVNETFYKFHGFGLRASGGFLL